MDFGTAIKTCFRKYVDFTGRARMSEYWWFVLFIVIAGICLRLTDARLAALFDIAVFLPHLAVGARRLHDINRSAWWLLLGLVPILGWIALLMWYTDKGDLETNRFGPSPIPEDPLRAET